jgi:hypothetical protein
MWKESHENHFRLLVDFMNYASPRFQDILVPKDPGRARLAACVV